MPLIQMKEVMCSPWGILEGRKQEAEGGSYGSFQRLLDSAMSERFLAIEEAAGLMGCHTGTARKWLAKCDARYVTRDGANGYLREDVAHTIAERKAAKKKKGSGQAIPNNSRSIEK